MKRTGFNGYIYDFSVDYEATDVDDIKDIHKYLIKKITLYKLKYLDFSQVNPMKNLKIFFYTMLFFLIKHL